MFLPSGSIFLVKFDGTEESCECIDIGSYSDFVDEVDDLLKYYGTTRDSYLGAKYYYKKDLVYDLKF